MSKYRRTFQFEHIDGTVFYIALISKCPNTSLVSNTERVLCEAGMNGSVSDLSYLLTVVADNYYVYTGADPGGGVVTPPCSRPPIFFFNKLFN